MAKKSIELVESARLVFYEATGYASEKMGRDIGKLMLEGSQEEIDDTRLAQPTIFIASITGSTALRELLGRDADLRVGHSFGHIAAMHDDGVFDTRTGIDLSIARGEFMHQAAIDRPGSMAAVLKMASAKVSEVAAKSGVYVANDNSESEIIISGEENRIDNSREEIERAGGRFIKLKVKAAAHSPLVEIAGHQMGQLAERLHISTEQLHIPDSLKIMSSRTVEYLRSIADIKADIAGLTQKVEWRNTVARLVQEGYTDFFETGPGQKLSNLPRRDAAMRRHFMENGVKMTSLEQILDDLPA